MGYLGSISHHVWLERFLAVSQPFLSHFYPFLGVSQPKNAWLHTVSMGNGDFELFLPVLGPSNSIESIFLYGDPFN